MQVVDLTRSSIKRPCVFDDDDDDDDDNAMSYARIEH